MAIIHIVRIVAASTKNKWSFHFWRRVLEHRNATANLNNFPIYLITVYDVMCCCTTPKKIPIRKLIDRMHYIFQSLFSRVFLFFFRLRMWSSVIKRSVVLKKNVKTLSFQSFAYLAVSNFLFHPDELVVVFSDRKKMNEKNPRKSSPKFINDKKKTYTQTHCVEYAALSTQ